MKSLFDYIAKPYGLFYEYQKKSFYDVMNKHQLLFAGKTVLDMGCGTGAYSAVMYELGYDVEGVDISREMIRIARKKNKHISYEHISASSPSIQKKYDIVFSAFVAHGMKQEERMSLYETMKNCGDLVILYDYNDKRKIITTVIEWLEGGDYFHFIKHVEDELLSVFSDVSIIQIGDNTALYCCRP